MTQARSSLVCLADTPYYHITTRCVRRAFLCGNDPFSGRNYEHRREWIRERLSYLESVFAIDIAAYAVMSNHCHIVVRLNDPACLNWDDNEVVSRWQSLFRPPASVEQWLRGDSQTDSELEAVNSLIKLWKTRLCDLGWFMRCLNEHIARRANAEDECTGRFWEGRYKSQALLDETALLTCMTYVDLNPIRSGMAKTPERSDYTSIQQRILNSRNSIDLIPFKDSHRNGSSEPIPFGFKDYLELVDWTGRAVLDAKRGSIPDHLPKNLQRLGIESESWLRTMRGGYSREFWRAVGPKERIECLRNRLKQRWICGVNAMAGLYPAREG